LETFPILLSETSKGVSEYPMKALFRSNAEEEEKETNCCDTIERVVQRTTVKLAFEDEKSWNRILFFF